MAKATATHVMSTEEGRLCSQVRWTPAQPRRRILLYLAASARQMKGCLSIRGMLSIIRPRRIPLDSSGTPTVSATEIWEWERSCEVVSALAPTQTGTGYNLHQLLMANFKCPRCAMWQ